MEKEFVPYELALRMKQLGFDEYCLTSYLNGELQTSQSEMFWFQHNYRSHPAQEFISAPLYQQAFRWFREKLKNSGLEPYDMVKNYSYNMKVSWEEAEAACLEKLLSIVEQKQKEI
jgi:hypothetical protein